MKQQEPTVSDIKKISSNFINGNMTVTKMNREGGDSIVYEIHTDDKDYIFRASGIRQNYDVEHAILKIAKGKKIKVPSVIGENMNLDKFPFTFSFQEKIEGVQLEKLPLKIWPSILEEVGQQLSMLYQVKVKGFGLADVMHYRKTGQIVGSNDSWKKAINDICMESFDQIIQKIKMEKNENFVNSKLTEEQKIKLLYIYDNFDQIILKLNIIEDFDEDSSILHGDLHGEHFIVKDNHLNGIIDFNKTIVGDPLFEIAYLSVMPNGDLYKHLLKTSGVKLDIKRFNLYRLLIAARKIHTRYVRFDYLHQYPEILDVVIEELKNIK